MSRVCSGSGSGVCSKAMPLGPGYFCMPTYARAVAHDFVVEMKRNLGLMRLTSDP